MTSRTGITMFGSVASAALIALAVAGCGGGGGTTAGASSTAGAAGASTPAPTTSGGAPAAPTPSAAPATLSAANSSRLGTILVNSQGRTLYLFKRDTGSTSTCTGACASAWPPLTVTGTPGVGGGANAALLGTTARSDGTTQVTYNGHPLYLFASDTNPGDTNGQGVTAFGAAWFAVTTSGNQASGQPSSSGGGGLGY